MKFILILSLLFSALYSMAQQHTLEVWITGIKESGTVNVQLFEEGQNYKPDSGECLEKELRITRGEKASVHLKSSTIIEIELVYL